MLAEARQQSGAQKLYGHDIMALERFDPETRHMLVFDVLSHDSPKGWKGEKTRLFLTGAGYGNALENQEDDLEDEPEPDSEIFLISGGSFRLLVSDLHDLYCRYFSLAGKLAAAEDAIPTRRVLNAERVSNETAGKGRTRLRFKEVGKSPTATCGTIPSPGRSRS